MLLDFAMIGFIVILASTPFRSDDKAATSLLVGASLFVVTFGAMPLESLTHIVFPRTCDSGLLLIDRALGFHDFVLARAIYATPWAFTLIKYSYYSLPLAIAVVYVLDPEWTLVRALVGAAIIGTAIYFIVPATGPAHAFPGFPWCNPHPTWQMMEVTATAPRNAFPSLHFGWGLILYMNSSRKGVRAILAVYLFLLALATVGSGEHYFVDLIASVPFAIAIQQLAEQGVPQWARNLRQQWAR